MRDDTLFRALAELGESDPRSDPELAARVRVLSNRFGLLDTVPYSGHDPEGDARRWLAEAERAVDELERAHATLPAAREAAAQERRSGAGKWVLLGAVLLIVLAILVGQGIW